MKTFGLSRSSLAHISLSDNLDFSKLGIYLKLWYSSMQLDFFFLDACPIFNDCSSFQRKKKFPPLAAGHLSALYSVGAHRLNYAKFVNFSRVYKITLFHPRGSSSRGM